MPFEARGETTWHRLVHVESVSGGTYGWWRACVSRAPRQFMPWGPQVLKPPPNERACAYCASGKPAKWLDTPGAADLIFNAIAGR